MEAYLKGLELGRDQRFIRAPKFRSMLVAAGLGMIFYALKMELQARKQIALKALKKERMLMPVYELTGEELVRPPWVDNYDAWKYRLVKFSGRPIHGKTFYVPTDVNQYPGYAKITPVVTREDDSLNHRNAILVNQGFMPQEYGPQYQKWVFNSQKPIEVIGVVTRGEDFDKKRFFRGGNAYQPPRWHTGHLDLRQFAEALNYENGPAMARGLVESVNLDLGFNFNSPEFYNRDLSGIEQVPFARTPAGFLNTEGDAVERHWKQFFLVTLGAFIAINS